ncbi:hypothetical protein AAHC03_021055 [Spirometra sp. Aus1]
MWLTRVQDSSETTTKDNVRVKQSAIFEEDDAGRRTDYETLNNGPDTRSNFRQLPSEEMAHRRNIGIRGTENIPSIVSLLPTTDVSTILGGSKEPQSPNQAFELVAAASIRDGECTSAERETSNAVVYRRFTASEVAKARSQGQRKSRSGETGLWWRERNRHGPPATSKAGVRRQWHNCVNKTVDNLSQSRDNMRAGVAAFMDEDTSPGSAEKYAPNPHIGEQTKWRDHFVQEGAQRQRQENAPQWSDWANGRLDRPSEGKPVGRVLRLGLGVGHMVDGCALSAASSSRSPAAQVLTPQVRLTSAVLAELFGRQEVGPNRGTCDERWDRTNFGVCAKRNDSRTGEKCVQREVEKSASLRRTVAWINSQIVAEERADDIKNDGEMDAAQTCKFTKVISLLYAAVKQVCPGMRTVRRWMRKRAHLTSLCKPVSTQGSLSTAMEAHCETSRLNSYQPAEISVLLHQQQDTLEANGNLSSQAEMHLWKTGFALAQHHQTGSTAFFASHSATNSCSLAHITGILENRYGGTATAPRAVRRDQVLVMATQIPEGLIEQLKRADRGDQQKLLVTACNEATEITASEIGTVDASEKTNFGTIPPRDWQTNRNADREDTVQTGWSGLGYETGPVVSQSAGAIAAAADVRKNERRHPKDEPQKDDCSSNSGASLVVNVRVRVAIDERACKGKGNHKVKRHTNVRGGGTTKDGRLKAGPHEAPDAGGVGKARDGSPHIYQAGGVAKTQTIKPETRIGLGNSSTSGQSSHVSEEDLTGVKMEQKRGKAEKNKNTKSQKNSSVTLPSPGQVSDDLHSAPESGLFKNKLGSIGSQEGSSEGKERYNNRRNQSSGSKAKADAETLHEKGEEVVIADERGGGWKETTKGATAPKNGPVKTANQKEISDGLNIATEGGPHKPGSEAPQRNEGSPAEMQAYKTGSKKSSKSVKDDSQKSTDARRSSDDINGTAQSGPRNLGSYDRRELSDSSPEDQASKKGKSRRSEVTAPVATTVANTDDLLKERELSGVENEQGRGSEKRNESTKSSKNGLVTSADPNRSTSGVNFPIQDRAQVKVPEDTERITGRQGKATKDGGPVDTAAVTAILENPQVEGNLEGTEDDQNGGGKKRNESTKSRKGGSVASADPNRLSAVTSQSGPQQTVSEKGGIGRPATTTAATVDITNADGQHEEGKLVRAEDEQSRGVSAGHKSSEFRQNESAIPLGGGQSSKDLHVLAQSEQQEGTLGDRGQKSGPEETEVYKSQGTKSAGPTDFTVVTVIAENSSVEGKAEEITDGPQRGNEATGESTGPRKGSSVVPENLNLLSDGLGVLTQDGPHETALDLPRRGEGGLESTEGREGEQTRMSGPAIITPAKATTANLDALYGEGELVSVEQVVEERAENRTTRPLENGSVTVNDLYALAQSDLQEATLGDRGQADGPEGTGVHGSTEATTGGSADAVIIENLHREGKPEGIKDEQNRGEETGSANAGPRKGGSVLSADLNHRIDGLHVTTQNGLHETGFDLPRRGEEEELKEAEGLKGQKGGPSGSVVAAIASDTRKGSAVRSTNDLRENGGGESDIRRTTKTASALEEGGPGGSFGQTPTTWEMVQMVTIDDSTNLPDELTLESETEKFIRKLANQSTATRCRRLGDTNVLLDRLIMDTARSIRRGVQAVGRKGR